MNADDRPQGAPLAVIRDEVRALSAYAVPPSTPVIKLDAMENPYGLPRELKQSIAALIAESTLNRYPDPRAPELKTALRKALAVPYGMELVLGNGSDEIIQMLALATAKPGAVLLAPEPSFVMYRIVANVCGLRYVGVPLADDFSLDPGAMAAAVAQHSPALTFLAYPNNPTGNLFDDAAVEEVLNAASGLVVIDEAYHPFARKSFMRRLGSHGNLLVMRTLSKLGLAGLRLGILAGSRELLAEIDKIRLPYNVGVLTQNVALEVLHHGAVLDAQAAAIRRERSRLAKALAGIAGITVFPSAANFIMFRVAQASRVFAGIKQRGVLVKNLDGSHPQLADCLRVSVGTPLQNDLFLAALSASL
jgi:histidinol-phosphate aminotransferase